VSSVVLIDYNVGNLLSLRRALEHGGATVRLVTEPAEIKPPERVVLPGVGAFGYAINVLRERGFAERLIANRDAGGTILGICLGMQLIFDSSEEFGHHEGLGLIAGRVLPIPKTNDEGCPRRIPHIGWSELVPGPQVTTWAGSLLERVRPGESAYFVHSFMAVPDESRHRLADTEYDGIAMSAVVSSGQVHGCQFHPEKSGPIGLSIIKQFLSH
jgi:glutamine amidotransferase